MKTEDKKRWILSLLLVFIVLVVGIFLGYKLYILAQYSNLSFKSISDSYKIEDTLEIKNNLLNAEEYLQYSNIKIRNEFDDYNKIVSDNTITYINNGKRAKLTIKTTKSYLEEYFLKNNALGNDEERINYIKKNNLNSDEELFTFIAGDNYQRNLFTSSHKIKGIYSLYEVASTINSDKLVKIIGDIKGYMFVSKDTKEVSIEKGNNVYHFIFSGSYFTEDKVIDLIKTIVIN